MASCLQGVRAMMNQHEFTNALKYLIQARARYFASWDGHVVDWTEEAIDDVSQAAAIDAFSFIDKVLHDKYMNEEWRDDHCSKDE